MDLYYLANREKKLQRAKERYQAKKEECLAYQKKYYKANKSKCDSSVKAWIKKNPEKARKYGRAKMTRICFCEGCKICIPKKGSTKYCKDCLKKKELEWRRTAYKNKHAKKIYPCKICKMESKIKSNFCQECSKKLKEQKEIIKNSRKVLALEFKNKNTWLAAKLRKRFYRLTPAFKLELREPKPGAGSGRKTSSTISIGVNGKLKLQQPMESARNVKLT